VEVRDRSRGPRRIGAIAREASLPPDSAAVLMKVIRAFRPRYGIEMGTCVGISTAYQAAGMAMNGHGRLVSLEGYEALCAVARRNLAALGLERLAEVRQGRFDSTLEPALGEAPPDYGFIDGHHLEDATVRYYQAFTRAAEGSALLVFDDIDWSDGMRRAWRRIERDERTAVAMTLGRFGFCFLDGTRRTREDTGRCGSRPSHA
jgi:predicted O-methyltransferase YrrM